MKGIYQEEFEIIPKGVDRDYRINRKKKIKRDLKRAFKQRLERRKSASRNFR